jgi:hypothetical protein
MAQLRDFRKIAKRPLIKTGVGVLSDPGRIRLGPDGKIGPEAIQAFNDFLAAVVKIFNAGLSFGTGAQSTQVGNFFAQYVEFTAPSAADTEIEIPHGLGAIPIGFWPIFHDTKDADLYASSFGSWGEDKLFVKSSLGDVLWKIIVF